MSDSISLLITGASSGIGWYLHQSLGGIGLTRHSANEDLRQATERGVELIIHCAFNSAKDVDSRSLSSYLDDNLLLTQRLLEIPHEKFVYFSSVDVYPSDGSAQHREDDVIVADQLRGVYALTKLSSEALVLARANQPLILRPTTMLGPLCRPNTISRLMDGWDGRFFLAERSLYNIVLYEDIARFISRAVNRNLTGIYNIAAAEPIELGEIAAMIGRSARFGSHLYRVAPTDNAKASAIEPAFLRTSAQAITTLIERRKRHPRGVLSCDNSTVRQLNLI